jgi:hypothetical protein
MFKHILGVATSLMSAVMLTASVAPSEPTPPPKPQELIRLEEFLMAKGSPMPADLLYQHPNWKMMLAISLAESGYCKNPVAQNNCWGIKDFRAGKNFGGYRSFETWEEAYAYTSELLYKYDEDDGMPDPGRMAKRWKYIEPLTNWTNAVYYALADINKNTAVEEVAIVDPNSTLA